MMRQDKTLHQQEKPACPVGRSVFWNRSDRLAITVLLAVWGICLTCHAAKHAAALDWPAKIDSARVETVLEKINPNTASPASLRRLPGIGPVKAEAIVAYRQDHPVKSSCIFNSEKDLETVPGIGPEIVKRISNHLVFNKRQP